MQVFLQRLGDTVGLGRKFLDLEPRASPEGNRQPQTWPNTVIVKERIECVWDEVSSNRTTRRRLTLCTARL